MREKLIGFESLSMLRGIWSRDQCSCIDFPSGMCVWVCVGKVWFALRNFYSSNSKINFIVLIFLHWSLETTQKKKICSLSNTKHTWFIGICNNWNSQMISISRSTWTLDTCCANIFNWKSRFYHTWNFYWSLNHDIKSNVLQWHRHRF